MEKATIKTRTPCIGVHTTTDEIFQQVVSLVAKRPVRLGRKRPVRLGRWLLEDKPFGYIVQRFPEKFRGPDVEMEEGLDDVALMHRSTSLCVAAGYLIGAWLGDWT